MTRLTFADWLVRVVRHPAGRAVAGAGMLAVVVAVCFLHAVSWVDWWWIDGEIYAAGGRNAWDGNDTNLYLGFDGPGPFTYTPFAALVFGPLGALPVPMRGILFQLVSVAAAVAAVAVVLRALRMRWADAWWTAVLLAVPVFVFYPVFRSVGLGQVDAQLLLLVLADLVMPRGRRGLPRGVLTGIAAAIKLTPAIMILYLVLRRDAKAIGWLVATATAATALGFALMPADSWGYWTDYLWRTDRVGAQFTAANQSLAAVLSRAFQPGQDMISGAVRILWVVLVLAAVIAGVWAIRRCLRAGRDVEAVLVAAMVGLLSSPMSWLHHWVWAVPMIVVLLFRTPSRRSAVVLGVVGIAAVGFNPRWLFGTTAVLDGTSTWGPWEQIVGAAAVWWGIAYLLVTGWTAGRRAEVHS